MFRKPSRGVVSPSDRQTSGGGPVWLIHTSVVILPADFNLWKKEQTDPRSEVKVKGVHFESPSTIRVIVLIVYSPQWGMMRGVSGSKCS